MEIRAPNPFDQPSPVEVSSTVHCEECEKFKLAGGEWNLVSVVGLDQSVVGMDVCSRKVEEPLCGSVGQAMTQEGVDPCACLALVARRALEIIGVSEPFRVCEMACLD